MCLRLTGIAALVAGMILGGAAFAEITVSQSNTRLVSDETPLLVKGAPGALIDTGSAGTAVAKSPARGLASLFGLKRTPAQPPAPVAISYTPAFLSGIPAAAGDAEWECLAKALYFEARGESVKGQFAVAEVILNRVQSPRYPSTICAVVHQGGKGGCQFSFTCDGYADRVREAGAWQRAGKIARLMIDGAPRALTEGATHFHTRAVRPGWARKFPQTAAIGAHLFYRQPGAGT